MSWIAQHLVFVTRWLGVAIAVVGALAVNPDATADRWQSMVHWLRVKRRAVRGFLAKYIKWLRQDAEVEAGLGGSVAIGANIEAHARGFTPMNPTDTIAEKIALLDRRTIRMDQEIGALQVEVRRVEKQLRNELVDAVRVLRGEATEIRESVDQLKQETVRLDGSALPIIIIGVLLSGLASDIENWPLWLAVLVLLGAVTFTVWETRRIYRDWRAAVGPA